MNPRETFLAACSQVSSSIAGFGFKSSKNGQSLKKIIADTDITGTKFKPYAHKHLSPLAFMLCLGKEAQEFFLNYLADSRGKGSILNLYKGLPRKEHPEFAESVYVKLAFLNGLKTSK